MALDENNGLKVTTTGVFEDPHGKYSSNILNPKIRIRRHSTSEQFVPIRGEARTRIDCEDPVLGLMN